MSSKSALYLRLELVWWLFTALVIILILYPIYNKLTGFPFYWMNGIYIVTAITLTRYMFLLPYTFLARLQIVKTGLVFVSIPFIFYLIEGIYNFNEYLDYNRLHAMVSGLPGNEQEGMVNYIKNEMLLFGVAAVISAIVFPFRMIISVWRLRNKVGV